MFLVVLCACSGQAPVGSAVGEGALHLFDVPAESVSSPGRRKRSVSSAEKTLRIIEVLARRSFERTGASPSAADAGLWVAPTRFTAVGPARQVSRSLAHEPAGGKTLDDGDAFDATELALGELVVGARGVIVCAPKSEGRPRDVRVAYEAPEDEVFGQWLEPVATTDSVPLTRTLTLGNDTRRALVLRSGSRVTWQVPIGRDSRLSVAYGVEPLALRRHTAGILVDTRPETEATFGIELRAQGEADFTPLWTATLARDDADRFVDVAVDLAPYAGRVVELALVTNCPPSPDGGPAQTFAAWAEPVLARAWTEDPPNVVVLLIDTLRADRLGCYGWERAQTPHIDALAARGVRFTDVWSAAPWTLPSHASLFSSLYVSEHGVWSPDHRLPDEVDTLAEVLREHGFSTAAFTEGGFVRPHFGFAQGFDRFVTSAGPPLAATTFGTAWDWIESVSSPFFAFVQTYQVHSPYDPSPELRERLVRPYSGKLPYSVHPPDWVREDAQHDFEEADLRYIGDLYDAEIAAVDDAVGELIARLEQAGILEHTLLILTSDHGEEFSDHGHFGHGWSLYEDQLFVPLIMYQKGRFEGGRVVEHAAHGVDIAPTVAAAAGAPQPPAWSGTRLSIDPPQSDRPLFVPYFTRGAGIPVVALRRGALKYTDFPDAGRPGDVHRGPKLFDLDADPGERTNLWDDSDASRWTESAQRLYLRYPLAIQPQRATVDASVTANLRALGYADDE